MGERHNFATMDKEKQRGVASDGGRAAHEKGTAHEWTPDQAREAGRRGGIASGEAKRARAAAVPAPASTPTS